MLISAVMSDPTSDTYPVRFYVMFSRLYTDFCTLISRLCVEGRVGLRHLYKSFLDMIIRNLDESVHGVVLVLANENLNAIINTLGSHYAHIQQHLRRRPGVSATSPPPPEVGEPTSREVSLAAQVTREESSELPSSTSKSETSTNTAAIPEKTTTTATAPTPAAGVTQATSSSEASSPARDSHTATSNTSFQSLVTSSNHVMSSRERSEPANPTRNWSDQNLRFVPPLMIVQH